MIYINTFFSERPRKKIPRAGDDFRLFIASDLLSHISPPPSGSADQQILQSFEHYCATAIKKWSYHKSSYCRTNSKAYLAFLNRETEPEKWGNYESNMTAAILGLGAFVCYAAVKKGDQTLSRLIYEYHHKTPPSGGSKDYTELRNRIFLPDEKRGGVSGPLTMLNRQYKKK